MVFSISMKPRQRIVRIRVFFEQDALPTTRIWSGQWWTAFVGSFKTVASLPMKIAWEPIAACHVSWSEFNSKLSGSTFIMPLAMVATTKEECTKEIYCPRWCSRGAPPVCAWFPYTDSNGNTGGRDMSFGSRCLLDMYACRNEQGEFICIAF